MTTVDGSAYLSAVRWGDEALYLSDFLQKFPQPQVARIVKGQYQHLGVPSLPNPSLNSIVFLAKGHKRLKISAQCVKFKDGRRIVPLGPKLAIPENYNGWFEILSEEGRCSRCYESVHELCRRTPESCLVRESMKVHLPQSDDVNLVAEKTKTLPAGEVLTIGRQIQSATVGKRAKSPTGNRFLRCVTSKSEVVYLPFDSRGKFSAIAKEENISGVHSVKNLLNKRFPLMARLVYGKPPSNTKTVTSEMRLFCVYEEETIMALPLLKDAPIVAVPPSAALKLQAPKNVDALIKLPEYNRLADRCKNAMEDVSDTIQVTDLNPPNVKSGVLPSALHLKLTPIRSISDPSGEKAVIRTSGIDRNKSESDIEKINNVDDQRYDEIDQIYDYVRGIAPLPDRIRRDLTNIHHRSGSPIKPQPVIHVEPTLNKPQRLCDIQPTVASPVNVPVEQEHSSSPTDKPPEPPPIETIPSHRRFSMVTDPGRYSPQPPSEAVNDLGSHIYEALRPADTALTEKRIIRKSSSTNRIPTTVTSNNKLFAKSNSNGHHGRLSQKPRFLRQHSRLSSVPLITNEVHGIIQHPPTQAKLRNKVLSRNNSNTSKSAVSTSPIFNIRYKSLTNLAGDFNNTLESSNSGGRTNSSGGTDSHVTPIKIPAVIARPKSLCNLFWDVDVNNKYNILQNETSKASPTSKYIDSLDPSPNVTTKNIIKSRMGTLYL